MRTVDYDALAASAPLDRQAAVVRDGRGDGYKPNLVLPHGYVHSDLPLPMRAADKAALNSPSFADLTGLQVGRLKVLGLYAVNSADKAKWVVRCSCGAYETRRAHVLQSPPATHPTLLMCFACSKVESLKDEAKKIAAGKAKPTEWVLAERRRDAEFEKARHTVVKAALAYDASACDDDRRALSDACQVYRDLVCKAAAERAAA